MAACGKPMTMDAPGCRFLIRNPRSRSARSRCRLQIQRSFTSHRAKGCIVRSADGGKSWVHLSLDDSQQIPSIAVDPRDANRVYAAVLGHPYGPSAQRGVYRSLDGGATWSKVLDQGENTGSSFIRIDPFDASILYAGFWNARTGPWEDKTMYNGPHGGLFKSTDGGEHWRPLTDGLPQGLSQLDVAVAPSARGRLFASVATSSNPAAQGGAAASVGIYRSD